MAVITTYDEMREELREDMRKCLEKAKELVVSTEVWGYEDMREDYAIEVFDAIHKAYKKI